MKNINNIPGRNPFKVPENYFEEVNRKIISATAGDDHTVKKTGIFIRFRPLLLAAAAITGFVILSYAITRSIRDEKPEPAGIYSETMMDPLFYDLDIYSIEENIETPELSDGLSGIKKSEIIDYLLLENIETEVIFEQL